MSFYKWLHRREYGYPFRHGSEDFILRRLYESIEPYSNWDKSIFQSSQTSEHGAIFNLEFSPDGNILLAACEKKLVLLHDPLTTQKINQFTAHSDSVNFIRFMDKNTFATCSDDTTIALWDLRRLDKKMKSLCGHTNWVKNIEYSAKDNLLVTSGFDGTIFTWDLNCPTEDSLIYQKVFHTSGLMRSRLTPDGGKLVVSTTGGYLMIVHDLNLPTLQKDLGGFRPSIFRLMQLGRQFIPQAARYDYVFSKRQKRNRVELVTDFPKDNDAEIIKSLQIHPHGHSFLSRNISYNTMAEWLCVHSLMEEPKDSSEAEEDCPHGRKRRRFNISDDSSNNESSDGNNQPASSAESELHANISENDGDMHTNWEMLGIQNGERRATIEGQLRLQSENFVPDIWAAEVTLEERLVRQNRARTSNSVHGYNLVYAISSGVLANVQVDDLDADLMRDGLPLLGNIEENTSSNHASSDIPNVASNTTTGNIYISSSSSSSSSSISSNHSGAGSSNSSSATSSRNSSPTPEIAFTLRPKRHYGARRDRRLFTNPKKLMFYIEDSPAGKGLIKEPCYSNDGRIIASPYENGARILSYTENCSEYPSYMKVKEMQLKPKELHVMKQFSIGCKKDNLLSCKFSPREPLIVGAYQSGKIAWYYPNF